MTEGNEIIIQCRDVTKQYGLFRNDRERLQAVLLHDKRIPVKKAVNNLSFDIRRGESVAVFGRNGAGKSTILKMLTGVTQPTSGIIRVGGRVSALLELTAGFDAELSGRENIHFRGEVMGLRKKEIAQLEPSIVDFAGLGNYIDMPIRTYSSGMRAKLGFAINANIRPDILIVDEALSVGDRDFRIKCRNKIRSIMEEGVTFLFVTHSASDARSFCQRGLVLYNGQLVFDGDVAEAASFYEAMPS